jgi:cardiolipin synthase (CMP-forming)
MARGNLTVPNLLTGLRLLLAPAFLWLYVRGDTFQALAAFSVAVATDFLDGLAARALDQRTRLGAVLDPIADKALTACALFALAARGRIPLWLPVLEASRDLAQLAATFALFRMHRPLPSGPTRVGKYATFALAATALLALAEDFGAAHAPLYPWVAACGQVAALCVAVSWVQYFQFFLRSARGQAPEGREA